MPTSPGRPRAAAEIRELGSAVSAPVPDGAGDFINLADDYATQTAAAANTATGIGPGIGDDPDPLITAPLYGRWHALTQRLLTNRDGTPAPNTTNWVHQLNLDPRFRVPASFGTDVVEANAEEYMNDAWEQIGDVLAANSKHPAAAACDRSVRRWYDGHPDAARRRQCRSARSR